MKTRNITGYQDFWFKIVGCLIISEVIDSIGREESLIERAGSGHFYVDLTGGFILALLLWEAIRFAIVRLDALYDWLEQPVKRISLQLLLGLILPSLLSILLTQFYVELIHSQDIFSSGWLDSELYAVILFILIINLVYFTWWIFLKWVGQTVQAELQHIPSPVSDILEVTKAGKIIRLPQQQIAYAFLNNGYCYVKPFDGDVFVTTYTLDELVSLLAEASFFRVNRQMLINRLSCNMYERVENGKIRLEISPAPKSEVIVSQKRASDFRKWIARR